MDYVYKKLVWKYASLRTSQWEDSKYGTFVWTVNLTLSLSLKASEISTNKDVSVVRSTVSEWSYAKCRLNEVNQKLMPKQVDNI